MLLAISPGPTTLRKVPPPRLGSRPDEGAEKIEEKGEGGDKEIHDKRNELKEKREHHIQDRSNHIHNSILSPPPIENAGQKPVMFSILQRESLRVYLRCGSRRRSRRRGSHGRRRCGRGLFSYRSNRLDFIRHGGICCSGKRETRPSHLLYHASPPSPIESAPSPALPSPSSRSQYPPCSYAA